VYPVIYSLVFRNKSISLTARTAIKVFSVLYVSPHLRMLVYHTDKKAVSLLILFICKRGWVNYKVLLVRMLYKSSIKCFP